MADTVNLGSVYGTLGLDASEWKKGIDQAKASLDDFAKNADKTVSNVSSSFTTKLDKVSTSMQSIGAKMSLAVTAPLVIFGKKAIDTAVDIEVKWKEVQKVYGSTAGAFERDNAMLADSVDNLSLKFGRSKESVLDALGAISAIGYEGSQAVDILTQSLEFATAGNMELEQSMETVVAASKIYNVEGSSLRTLLANLNKVENSTAASMEDLSSAIRVASSVSNLAGVDIKELSGFMAVLRERAIDGEEAANGLKTIFTRLRNPTADAQDILKKYNLTVEDTTKGAYKSVKGTAAQKDEIERLSKKLESVNVKMSDYKNGILGANLSDEKRQDKLKELNKEHENLQIALNKVGAAYDSTTSSVWVSNGALKDGDQILLELAEKWKTMTDVEREELSMSAANLYQKNKFLAIMDDLTSETSKYKQVIGDLADETGVVNTYEKEMAIFLDTNKTKINQAKVAFTDFSVAVGGILADALVPLLLNLKDLLKGFSELNPEVQKSAVYFGMFLAAVGPVMSFLGTMGKLILAAKKGWTLLAAGIGKVGGALAVLAGAIGISVGWLLVIIAVVAAVIAGAVLLYKNWDKVSQFLSTVWQERVIPAWEAFKTFIKDTIDSIGKFITEGIPQIFANLVEWVKQLFVDMAGAFFYGIGFMLGLVIYGIPKIYNAVVDFLKGLPDRIKGILIDAGIEFTLWAIRTYLYLSQKIPEMVNAVGEWLRQLPTRAWTALQDFGSKLKERIIEGWNAVNAELKTWPQRFYDWGKNIATEFINGIGNIGKFIGDKVKKGLDDAKKYLKGNSPPVAGPLKDIDKWGLNVGNAWVQGFSQSLSQLQGLMAGNSSLGSVRVDSQKESGSVAPTVAPVYNVYIGMYAGSAMEKRQIAKELNDALINYNKGVGLV